MLVELGLVEQRVAAVLEVVNEGVAVAEVARRHGVTRQTVHRWLRRFAAEGMRGLADRSSKPLGCPHQMGDRASVCRSSCRRVVARTAMEWKNPGRSGAAVYVVAGVVAGAVVTVFARLGHARYGGRRSAAQALPGGPIIVISNHASYADGVLLVLVCRRMGRSLRLIATAGVFRFPGLGWLARQLGFISVERGTDRAARALDVAVAALEAGEAVGLFPEGRTTRDPDNWPERAKTGAVRLALRSGAPIVPVAMVGTHRLLPRRRRLRSLLVNLLLRPKVLVKVGEPIDVGALVTIGSPITHHEVRALSDQVMAQLVGLVGSLRGLQAPWPTGVDPD